MAGCLLATLSLWGCNSNSPNSGAASAEPADPNAWPLEGLCAWRQIGSPLPCKRLTPKDAEQIERAMRAYVESEPAKAKFAADQLQAAARSIGAPFVSLGSDGQKGVSLGGYRILKDDEPGALDVRNTVSVTPAARWGFSFEIERRQGAWVVASLDTWRAWAKREAR